MDGSEGQTPTPTEPVSMAGRLKETMMKSPATSAAVVGGVALGTVMVFGLGEALLGAGAVYLAYRVFRKPTPPK